MEKSPGLRGEQQARRRVYVESQVGALSLPGRIALPRGETRVGRAGSCDIVMPDRRVSRMHARIIVEDDVRLEDLGSTNGTRINGLQFVGSSLLRHGDRVTLGSRTLRVWIVDKDEIDDQEQPTEQLSLAPPSARTPTRRGVGAVGAAAIEVLCPRCQAPAVPGEGECGHCKMSWHDVSPFARTEPEMMEEVAAETLAHPGPDESAPPPSPGRRRQEVSMPVRYISDRLEQDGRALDLSHGGAFVAAPEMDELGGECRLVLFPGGPHPIEIPGWVRHAIHKGPARGMGIEFSELSETAWRWLADVLDDFHKTPTR